MTKFSLLKLLVVLCVLKLSLANTLFNEKLEALRPRGLKVTFPDKGYTSVTFHGAMNRTDGSKEWQIYVPKPREGLWIMQDRNLMLEKGDQINYDITVNKNSVTFPIHGTWVVTEFSEDNYDFEPYCALSETVLQCGKKGCKGRLIFSEDFTTGIENLTQWQFENMYPQEPDYKFNVYLTMAVTSIDDGILKIKPEPTKQSIIENYIDDSTNLNIITRCTGQIATNECYKVVSGPHIMPPVISGKITTRKSFNFKYGKIEVRAKLPVGDWLIPEINLEPCDHVYGKLHYGSGLIRIAFARGNSNLSNELFGGAIIYDKEPIRSRFLKKRIHESTIWGDDYHNYTVVWGPTSIEMFVDGESYGYLNSTKLESDLADINMIDSNLEMQKSVWNRGNILAPLDEMFYISLGVTVGGIHNFPVSDAKPWRDSSPKAMLKFKKNKKTWYPTWTSSEMLVEYVKVYAL
ncbi:unnamed protein product, partial [Brenthis ino]